MTNDQDTSSQQTASSTESDEQTIEPSENALSPDDLQYPEFVFEEGDIDQTGSFDLEQSQNREEMGEWLSDLAGGLVSHDIAVESPNRHVIFGIRPDTVSMAFDPDEDHRGKLEVTFTLDAKIMTAQDPDSPKIGARGGRGFIPIEMLTTDREPEHFRCYNWIENPVERD